jgi:hypothetical protein
MDVVKIESFKKTVGMLDHGCHRLIAIGLEVTGALTDLVDGTNVKPPSQSLKVRPKSSANPQIRYTQSDRRVTGTTTRPSASTSTNFSRHGLMLLLQNVYSSLLTAHAAAFTFSPL